ncbi:N-acetylmuramoyl-L-alanine amidase [Nocardioides sp. GCM10027113]|uniref:N-acetylmuramoyl-L-alanine amidase n=1 Tax=unclassified Nocardioides TaxID=2615069 RepID=UPI003615900F
MTHGDGDRTRTAARRPLLKLAAGGVAIASVGALVRLEGRDDDAPGAALSLSTFPGSDVERLHLPLGDDLLPRTAAGRWESSRLPTSTHSMVAFTWGIGQAAPAVAVRSRTGGSWGPWQGVPMLHDVPEDEVAGASLTGTDLVWIGRADGIQIRVDGERPADLALVLLHPGRRPGDPLLGAAPVGRAATTGTEESARSEPGTVAKPRLVTREQWGANESLRDGRPSYLSRLKQVHVHHTVNSNSYRRDEVPALIRGMYAYHTQTLGWSDIGYNFLVDRFGRCFVGRAGGPHKLVRGAHTLGFNHESTGIAVIGNHESATPSNATLNGLAALAAWKLAPYGRNPRGEVRVESEGSDRYPAGRTVRLPVIDGHRDTNLTACPGKHLYAALPKVRRRAARIIAEAQQPQIEVEERARVTGSAHLGEELRVDPGSYRPEDASVDYRWLRGDRRIRGAREQTYRVRPWDVGKPLSCVVTLEKAGSDPVVQTAGPTGTVTADPFLEVESSAPRRVARVRVAVTAPDQVRAVPGGRVTVRVGDRTKTVDLEDGAAVVRFGRHRKLGPGRYPVTVTYRGDGVFRSASHEERLRVE